MRRTNLLVLVFSFVVTVLPAAAQTLIATVPVENDAFYLAANPATNKIYVVNTCGTDPGCGSNSPGTVTVIDGVTNTVTATITVGIRAEFLVVNSATNKIYVTNRHDNSVSVINGATNTVIKTISVGSHPTVEDVNPLTNKIYVVNNGNGQGTTMSVIDGSSDTVTATVTVGNYPQSVAVNSVTNTVYVVNYCGNQFGCNATPAPGTVSVVDGASNKVTATVTVGDGPGIVLVDSVTNKIWVQNSCGNTLNCEISGDNSHTIGTVTQIDGVTLATQTATVGQGFGAMAFNSVANQAYASNGTDNTVTVIDGVTLATQTVNVGTSPADIEVNAATDKIYVCNSGDNTVTQIDGVTLATTTVGVGSVPVEAWVNPVTNRIYVSNVGDNTVSVIGGPAPTALQFISVVPPCRLVDTRNANGEFGGPSLQGQQTRYFPIPSNNSCNIPSSAVAYSLNVTVVPQGPLGYLTVWPTGEVQPTVSTLNSTDGRVKANAAIVPAGYQGAVSFFVTNTTDLVLDIDGYFAAPSGATLAFYPLTPCRVADTRNADGPLGGPYLMAKTNRDFPVLEASACNIPSSAQAYSLNFTAAPHGFLGYLTVCPTPSDPSQNCPLVSTLNSYGGQVTANAAIVPAGTGGEIRTYPSNDTDLIIDINGYFGAPGQGGLSLYPAVPCRVLDTRPNAFQFELSPPVDVRNSACSTPSASQGYVFNATVVPQGPLDYLALWPDGENQPVVSTLNAYDGVISSNMAIVPAGATNGKVDAYANPVHKSDPTDLTNLILDISGYFAP